MVEGGIFHGDEEETRGWGGGTCGCAIADGEQGGNCGGVETVSAALDEGADQVAHHVVEESVGGDAVEEKAVGGVPLGVGDGAEGELRFRVGSVGEIGVSGGEGGEVVGAEDVIGGVVEGGQLQGPGTGPDEGGEGWRAEVFRMWFEVRGSRFERNFQGWSAEGEDAVLVGFGEGGVARVEVWGDDLGGEDADAGREAAVEGTVQIGGGNVGGEGEAGNLG